MKKKQKKKDKRVKQERKERREVSSTEDREMEKKCQAVLEKAERLFQTEKFGSAKHHFTLANQMVPSEHIEKKIQECEENAQKVSRAQGLLKEGYVLQRDKNLKKLWRFFVNLWLYGRLER